ncbi:hypothetical protein WN944_027232 [Citrus x changshan-huyou]|uniref:Uncharacterized protein n=1 Tax=Citrus x changshan-huyou TaxID=2935761 RepID=A0AAP0LHM1_9ROSI
MDTEAVFESYKVALRRAFTSQPSPKANSANHWKPSPPPPV